MHCSPGSHSLPIGQGTIIGIGCRTHRPATAPRGATQPHRPGVPQGVAAVQTVTLQALGSIGAAQSPPRQVPTVQAVPSGSGRHLPFLQRFLPFFRLHLPFLHWLHSAHAGLHFLDLAVA